VLGYRFRLHRRGLPGTPDMVFPKYRVAVQVHGCFWHGHEGCRHAKRPQSNIPFWNEKIERNRARGLRTARGCAWRAQQISAVMKRPYLAHLTIRGN